MKKVILFSLLLLSFYSSFSQDDNKDSKSELQLNAGIGLGIDYGGVGGRFSVSPVDRVFLFGAVGYNLAGLGYNIGAGFRPLPARRFSPYVIGMYGYNGVVALVLNDEYQPEFTKSFNGASLGVGFEQRRHIASKNFWNFELLFPLRSQSYKDYKTMLENRYKAEFISLPVAISIGYHFGF